MSGFSGIAKAPILSTIAKEILALVKSDAGFRELQSVNAPRACYPDAATLNSTTPYRINEARAGNETFAQLVIVLHSTAGALNYRVDGPDPTNAIIGGVPVPAGAGTITINGNDNIARFAMLCEAGATAPFFRYLFK